MLSLGHFGHHNSPTSFLEMSRPLFLIKRCFLRLISVRIACFLELLHGPGLDEMDLGEEVLTGLTGFLIRSAASSSATTGWRWEERSISWNLATDCCSLLMVYCHLKFISLWCEGGKRKMRLKHQIIANLKERIIIIKMVRYQDGTISFVWLLTNSRLKLSCHIYRMKIESGCTSPEKSPSMCALINFAISNAFRL